MVSVTDATLIVGIMVSRVAYATLPISPTFHYVMLFDIVMPHSLHYDAREYEKERGENAYFSTT